MQGGTTERKARRNLARSPVVWMTLKEKRDLHCAKCSMSTARAGNRREEKPLTWETALVSLSMRGQVCTAQIMLRYFPHAKVETTFWPLCTDSLCLMSIKGRL